MIRVADRYLAIAVLQGIILAVIALLGLDALLSFLGEAEDFDRGDYDPGVALYFIAVTAPRRLYEWFPAATAVGIVLSLGRMAAANELVALRSSGYSRRAIAAAVVGAIAVFLVPLMISSELLMPMAERYGQSVKVASKAGGESISSDKDLWVREGDRIIFARQPLMSAVRPGEQVQLDTILAVAFDADGRVRSLTQAARGEHDGERWILRKVQRSILEESEVVVEHSETLTLPSLVAPQVLASAVARPRFLSIRELAAHSAFMRANKLDPAAYRAALWTRLAYPLAVVGIALIGVSSVFGMLRERGFGSRLFVGLVLGIGFYVFSRVAADLGQIYSLHPAAGAFLPALALLGLGIVLIRRRL